MNKVYFILCNIEGDTWFNNFDRMDVNLIKHLQMLEESNFIKGDINLYEQSLFNLRLTWDGYNLLSEIKEFESDLSNISWEQLTRLYKEHMINDRDRYKQQKQKDLYDSIIKEGG